MPALLKDLPLLVAGPAGLLTTIKAGFALKFFWLTAILAGTGFLLFGFSKPAMRDKAKQNFDKFNKWFRGIGKDDEWDRFFEEEAGA